MLTVVVWFQLHRPGTAPAGDLVGAFNKIRGDAIAVASATADSALQLEVDMGNVVRPFAEVVVSTETSSLMTATALASLLKFLSLGLLGNTSGIRVWSLRSVPHVVFTQILVLAARPPSLRSSARSATVNSKAPTLHATNPC